MGLSSRLRDPRDPLRRFIQSQFAHVDTIKRDLRERAPVLNFAPPDVEGYVLARIGWALDYRLRLYFPGSSPFDTTAVQGAAQLARRVERADETAYLYNVMFKTLHGELTVLPEAEQRRYVLDDMDAVMELTERLEREGQLSGGLIPVPRGFVALGRAIESEIGRLKPVGRVLDANDEWRLCGLSYLLGLYENPRYRAAASDSVIARIALLEDVNAQLAFVPEVALDDVSAMSRKFAEVASDLFGQSSIVDAHFPPRSSSWSVAEVDLVVGSTLIDIKTTRTLPTGLSLIYQLVGYLLADAEDFYGITEVGWYLARYGTLVTWPVAEFLDKLAGRTVDLASLRARVLPIEQW